MNRLVAGALGGLIATVPMTAVMLALHRRLPRGERYKLPPRELTMQVADRAGGLEQHMSEFERTATSLAAHFGYGAVTGALYPLLPAVMRRRQLLAGSGYGVFIWAASYLGWVPAMRLLTPATEHPSRRNALMIAAHFVWGAATAWVSDALTARAPAPRPARPRAPDVSGRP